MDEDEAFQQSRIMGAVAGAITSLVTGSFSMAGRGGVEKPLDPSQYTVRDLVKTGLWKDKEARGLLKQTVKGFVKDVSDEALEEGIDQYLQGVAAFATDPSKETQDKSMSEVLGEAAYAAALGGAGGGGAGGGAPGPAGPGTAATANTGGGGGAGWRGAGPASTSGSGGSGIVILKVNF